MIDPNTAGGWIGAFAFAAWGVIQTRRAGKAEARSAAIQSEASGVSAADLARRNEDLAEAYRKNADEWKEAYQREHNESEAYHKWVHDKAGKDQETMLSLSEENARLRALTDLTPVIKHMESQSLTNERISVALVSLTAMVEHLTGAVRSLLERISATDSQPKTT